MRSVSRLREWLAESYWAWRLYHVLVADAASLQQPTKFPGVYEYLYGNLGCVADLGCGPGIFLRYLCVRATHVFALDVDAAALRRVKARHRDIRDLQFIVSQVNRLPFSDDKLDTVLFLEVLEHLMDDAGALREINRVLVPGGKLVLSVPTPPGEINEGEPWGHKREGYTLAQLKDLLGGQGFVIRDFFFAQFKFSRLAENLVRHWRRWCGLPAPIFLSWPCYLDFLLSSNSRKAGDCLPACIVVSANKV